MTAARRRYGDSRATLASSFGDGCPDGARWCANRPTLGMILVEMGVLTEEQLTQAVATQVEQQVPLVQVLLESGLATQDQVLGALRSRPQYG